MNTAPRPTAEAEREAHEALQAYTLAHGDPAFLHQHVVDAWAAQHARVDGKAIGIAFALIGLHLHLERGYDGRGVQRAHARMAGRQRDWPRFTLPAERGAMTVCDVMRAAPGGERDRAIEAWCASVWEAYASCHAAARALAREARAESAPGA